MTSKEEKDILTFIRNWDESMVRNDSAEISCFMHPDWTILGSDGLTTKTEFLETIRSGLVTHHRMDADEIIIHPYNNFAIVFCRGTSAGTYKDQPFSLYEWSTNVLIREKNEWLCLTTMVTPSTSKP